MVSVARVPGMRRGRPHEIIPEGTPFGRYRVVSGPHAKPEKPTNFTFYLCRCECGTEKLVHRGNLTSGSIVSCGCHRRDRLVVHGYGHSRIGNIRTHMIQRCHNPKNPNYAGYGERGIVVCDEWRESYEAFRDWALANGYQDDLTIERRDVDGNYEPSNCTWIPAGDQNKNKRNSAVYTAFGETKCLADWIRDPRCSVTRDSLTHRMKHGWDFVRSLILPTAKAGGFSVRRDEPTDAGLTVSP